jgi:hypothetical protein
MRIRWLSLPLLNVLVVGSGAAEGPPAELTGICEASAAVEFSPGVVAVGDDETNGLFLYDMNNGASLTPVDLNGFLGVLPDEEGHYEGVDIEGAAQVGDIVYWITSHSLTKKAKSKPERFRFFATRSSTASDHPSLEPIGRPYQHLRDDVLRAVPGAPWALADAATRSPERGFTRAETDQASDASNSGESGDTAELHREGGFNIEGLAEGPQGSLLLGFRSPVRAGMALILPLKNPQALVNSPASDVEPSAEFDPPIAVNLGGLGIRSIERLPGTSDYIISAGPISDGAGFRLFRWHYGDRDATPIATDTGGLIAEALVLPSGRAAEVLIMSDEGDTERCTQSPPRFRASLLPLGETSR